ncbi:MAG: beta strand repeat-containing protein [Bacteroidota bacterium]
MIALVVLVLVCKTEAATITSNNVTGFWDAGGTWVGGVAPGPGDDVVINASATITVRTNVSCLSLSWTGNPAATRTFTINAGFSLTVTGNISLGAPTTGTKNRTISVLGTLNCNGNFNMAASGNNSRDIILSVGTAGTANIDGNLTMASTFVRHHVDLTGNAQINIGGNIGANATGTTAGGGFTTPPAGSIINLNGTLPQNFFTQNAPVYSGTFKINNAAGVILRRTLALGSSTLTIGDIMANSLFKDSGNRITCTGTLNLNNNSTLRLGRYSGTGGTATVFPAFATINIAMGTTVHFAHANNAQRISIVPSYANLLLSTTGSLNKTIAAGTLTVRENLTIETTTRFNGTNDPAINVGGNFTNNGTFNSGNGLFTMNGNTDQTITSSTTPTFTGGIAIANTGTDGNNTVTLGTDINVNNVLTITSGVFNLSTYTANRTVAGGTLSLANNSRLIIGGPNTFPANYTTHVIGVTSFVEYQGNNSVVAALNSAQSYGHLIISGTGVTSGNNFAVSGELTVSGSFTASAGTVTMNNAASSIINNGAISFNMILISATPTNQNQYDASYEVNGSFEVGTGATFNPTGGTITMTGVTGQIINSGGTLAFNGLTIEGTIMASGNMSVNGTMLVTGSFNPAAATIIGGSGILSGTGTIYVTRVTAIAGFSDQYTLNNSLLELATIYDGAGAQTVTGENYGTLVIADNGARTVTLIANETIGVAGQFNPDENNTTYIIANNTFDYNGSQDQIITGFTYNKLVISGPGDKTILTGIVVNCSGLDIVTNIQLNIEGTAELNFL